MGKEIFHGRKCNFCRGYVLHSLLKSYNSFEGDLIHVGSSYVILLGNLSQQNCQYASIGNLKDRGEGILGDGHPVLGHPEKTVKISDW